MFKYTSHVILLKKKFTYNIFLHDIRNQSVVQTACIFTPIWRRCLICSDGFNPPTSPKNIYIYVYIYMYIYIYLYYIQVRSWRAPSLSPCMSICAFNIVTCKPETPLVWIRIVPVGCFHISFAIRIFLKRRLSARGL